MNKLLKLRDPLIFNIIQKEFLRQKEVWNSSHLKILHPNQLWNV